MRNTHPSLSTHTSAAVTLHFARALPHPNTRAVRTLNPKTALPVHPTSVSRLHPPTSPHHNRVAHKIHGGPLLGGDGSRWCCTKQDAQFRSVDRHLQIRHCGQRFKCLQQQSRANMSGNRSDCPATWAMTTQTMNLALKTRRPPRQQCITGFRGKSSAKWC